MDQPKIERMLRLMKLLAGNTNYTIDDLAEKLDMSYRTIYRYIDTFKSSGFAVPKLYGNVYKLAKMPKRAPDFENLIYFSEEEAYIVNSLIDNLDQTNNLKANLKRKLTTIYNSTGIAEFVDKKSTSANIRALSEAIKNKQKVRLKGYESARSETVKDRLVEPFAFTTNLIDVWAYDLSDLHNKVFKISRIGEVEAIDEDWEFESSHRRQSTDVFRMSGKSPKKIKLRLGIRAKNLLLEEYPLAAKDITRKGAYWILETGVYDYAGACRFYVGLAEDIEIQNSPEFEEYVKGYLKRISSVKMAKSEYISRPTAQHIIGCDKETIIDLLEREVIESYKRPNNSWAILRSSVEAYSRQHPKQHYIMLVREDSLEYVSRLSAQKRIGCSKDEIKELIESGKLQAYCDDKGRWRVRRDSLQSYLDKLSEE